MELVKKYIHRNRQKSRVVSQLALDDDINVPDSKPDAIRILSERAIPVLEQKKALTGRLVLSGKLDFCVLYATNEEDNKIQCLKGKIPFEETINMENLEERDNAEVRWTLEDFQVSMINSRKISMKAVLAFVAEARELVDEEIVTDVEAEEPIYTKKETVRMLQLLAQKKDTFRVKEELTLDNNRPNIYELLWEDVGFHHMEIRPEEGRLSIQGEMEVFLLYTGEEEGHSLQWMTATFPVQGDLECQGAKEGAICDIRWSPEHFEMAVAPDFDGEERVVHIEGILGLDIQMYEEEEVSMLADAYSTAKELTLKKAPGQWEQLMLNNESQIRLNPQLNRGDNKAKIMQSCYGQGIAQIEQVRQTGQGLEIEGKVALSVLYVTAEDETPFDSMKEKIPFTLKVEVPELNEDCRIFVRAHVEQVELAMNSTDQLEVRVTLNVHSLVLCKPKAEHIISMEEAQLNMERLQEMPGMVGYIVQPGDNLWEIAKENHTTMEKIQELNQLSGEELHKGQKLVILKAVSQ